MLPVSSQLNSQSSASGWALLSHLMGGGASRAGGVGEPGEEPGRAERLCSQPRCRDPVPQGQNALHGQALHRAHPEHSPVAAASSVPSSQLDAASLQGSPLVVSLLSHWRWLCFQAVSPGEGGCLACPCSCGSLGFSRDRITLSDSL